MASYGADEGTDLIGVGMLRVGVLAVIVVVQVQVDA